MAAASLWQLDAVSLGAARLREITVEIGRGITAIVGSSGAGKSSLINLLAAFEQPERGTLAGTPRVSWAPQGGGLWHHCTVREHLEITGAEPAEAARLIAEFDLTRRIDARPDALSQGERSRLSIARALALKADVYLLDEPLAHLDSRHARECWRVILRRVAEGEASLVYSTHSPETVIADAHAVICLHEGRLLHAGPALELYRQPATPELMWFLGAGNWFTEDDARRWLGVGQALTGCVRPERLAVEAADECGFVVRNSRFLGSLAETELESETMTRTFFHRPILTPPTAGARVRLRVLEP